MTEREREREREASANLREFREVVFGVRVRGRATSSHEIRALEMAVRVRFREWFRFQG